ncbi:MAG: TRAP transporter small permease subunit [Ectothiorhodospiraceae bacterium]|nr:TRAP transporter small permease subunit [Ectothiorhodospiraceae bacterium]
MFRVLRLVDWLNTGVAWVFSWAVILMMLITVYDVAMRYFFASPTIWAFDITTQLYGLHFMILAGYALTRKAHVSVDIVTELLSPKVRAVVDLIGYTVFFLPFMVVLIWRSYGFAMTSWARQETTWGIAAIPVYPIKTVIVVAACLLLLQGLVHMIRTIVFLAGYEDPYSDPREAA